MTDGRGGGRRGLAIPIALGLAVAGRAILQRRHAIDLDGRVVLITGSSRGLGLALADECAAAGARLVICGRDADVLERARARLTATGVEVLAVPCDVADRAQAEALVARAIDRFGRVDVLVNNAGVISVGPLETQTVADFEEAIAVMCWGTLYPTLAALPGMRARAEGRIVNITSIGGKVAVPHLLPYSVAKFAAVGLSQGLRAELAKDGISVTTVVPGLMRTGSHLNAYFKGEHRAEFTWFSLGASLPLSSMAARTAARRIVAALRRGQAELTLTPQAQLLAWFHGLFPGLTADLLGLVDRLLPRTGGIGEERRTGGESGSPISRSFLTRLGEQAAHEYQQYRGEAAEDGAPVAVKAGEVVAGR